jgi:hypothetical protein
MTTEADIFEPYSAYERVVEVLTHEGWGNIIADPLTWKPELVPKDVGLQFSVSVDQKAHRLNVIARRDGRLADTFSLSTNTGVTVTLSLITDMMRAAKTGEIA